MNTNSAPASTPLCLPAAELPPPGGRAFVKVQGHDIALFDIEGCLHAVGDSCPHGGASLSRGRLDGHLLQCPAHGLRFDLVRGHLCNVPAVRLQRYLVRREADTCWLTPQDTADHLGAI